ncbi:MAG: formyltransferase [Thiomonas sp.]|uniref:formyltransferase n=1 Tax=Thiomonas sp. TaxID=2047785 RepID=UPI002A363F5A|nr:formyltransferase [Thiomonas sp.]MDY0329060.1 formyltransferase [Thiomonas sp.]
MNAVVFAYHNVGVRCLKTLLARGMQVQLVVTHPDSPSETLWFDRVADVADEAGISVAYVDEAVDEALIDRVVAAAPDYLFSFYFRRMLPARLLAAARIAALNMHGSLLPKYRGRVPVNWAVLHGETETGATLHVMQAKPDAGDIVAQQAVPILPDDTAKDVFDKVSVAAEIALWRVLPQLLRGEVPRQPNDLSAGSYFGGRKPEDGRIDWAHPAQTVYNLIRAVAPPYPGAFFDHCGRRFIVARARIASVVLAARIADKSAIGLHLIDGQLLGRAGDGGAIHILELWDADQPGVALSPRQISELVTQP